MSTEKLVRGKIAYEKGKSLHFHYETKIALSLFEEAAAENYPPVYVEFARLYEGNSRLFRGKPGVPRDDAKRAYWMNKVAENFDWFEKEAEKGTEEAFKNLAYCYEHGLGVEQSFPKAYNYYMDASSAKDDALSKPREVISDLEMARIKRELLTLWPGSNYVAIAKSDSHKGEQPENNQSHPEHFSSVLSRNNVGSNSIETTQSNSEGTYKPASFY